MKRGRPRKEKIRTQNTDGTFNPPEEPLQHPEVKLPVKGTDAISDFPEQVNLLYKASVDHLAILTEFIQDYTWSKLSGAKLTSYLERLKSLRKELE